MYKHRINGRCCIDLSIFEITKLIEAGTVGTMAVAASLLLSVLINNAGMIPSVILSGINVAIFGYLPGFFYILGLCR